MSEGEQEVPQRREHEMFDSNYKELKPVFENVRGYYKKAHTYEGKDGSKTLVSYATTVAKVIDGVAYRGYGAPQSATTARHMREFFQQEGFDKMMMNDLRALPTF